MPTSPPSWTLLVYRIPAQPTRLRLSIWRRLGRMGVVYLQDAVCLLPSRPDLDENMQYIAEAIAEMGGAYHLFSATTVLPGGNERLIADFQNAADQRMDDITARLDALQTTTTSADAEDLDLLQETEDSLKRERVTYLQAKRLSYFGSTKERAVDEQLTALRASLDALCGGGD